MKTIPLIALILLTAVGASAQLSLPSVFSDGMVLQQQKPIPVWGEAAANASVSLTLGDVQVSTTADARGYWKAEIPARSHGGPYVLSIVSGDSSIGIQDVLIGEVWLASGQSNMAWALRRSTAADLDIALSANPMIRFSRGAAGWIESSPGTSGNFSGVAYFFASALQQALGVPVGIIERARGSSAAEAWVSTDVLRADGRFGPMLSHWEKLEQEGWDQEEQDRLHQEAVAAWQARVDAGTAGNERQPGVTRNPLTGPKRPGIYFDSLLTPVAGYGIRGVIWYQGEANTTRAAEYAYLFPLLIMTWRELWQDDELPFLWAQLPNFQARDIVANSHWAELREAQTQTLSLPATGQAVTIDVGSAHTIHPPNKLDVGRRLARIALADYYGVRVAGHSPIYADHEIKGARITVRFDSVGAGLTVGPEPGPIPGFAIAADDRVFHPASARITGTDTVEVYSPSVTTPVAVRYAWANNPAVNLYSKNDLPVTPFRTDDWEEITVAGQE